MPYSIYNSKNKKVESYLSLEELGEYVKKHNMKALGLRAEFDDDEKPFVILKNTKDDLEIYKKSLNLAQINDINTGVKEICWSREIGFYLKVLRSGEEMEHHFTNRIVKEKDVVVRQDYKEGDLIKLNEYGFLPEKCKQYFSDECGYVGMICIKSFSYELRIKFP